ncbi:MAG: DUF1036 domain-containing protein [Pseudomonadota bacterium]|nr:DUF1036 domain-containing protein [Pseudomonadota bacterium]
MNLYLLTYIRRSLSRSGAILTALFVLSAPQTASAQFSVCNRTFDVINVALGQYDIDDFETSGWWTVGPNQCANVIDRILTARYVYVFAQDVFGREILTGATPMCVAPKRFDIKGDGDCLVRGYLEAKFQEVDTLRSERWTLFIYPPAGQS